MIATIVIIAAIIFVYCYLRFMRFKVIHKENDSDNNKGGITVKHCNNSNENTKPNDIVQSKRTNVFSLRHFANAPTHTIHINPQFTTEKNSSLTNSEQLYSRPRYPRVKYINPPGFKYSPALTLPIEGNAYQQNIPNIFQKSTQDQESVKDDKNNKQNENKREKTARPNKREGKHPQNKNPINEKKQQMNRNPKEKYYTDFPPEEIQPKSGIRREQREAQPKKEIESTPQGGKPNQRSQRKPNRPTPKSEK